jgi:diadenosine tetraphosphate (Ap4A) HIT family hydrolase
MVSATPTDWQLDPKIAAETIPVGDLALTRVLLATDANYPWLILVPRRPGLIEIIDLEQTAQVQLMGEINVAAHILKSTTKCEKLNIAALGNVVAQLHVHVVGRHHSDPAWPKPIWGVVPPIAYDAGVRDGLVDTLRRGLQIEYIRN